CGCPYTTAFPAQEDVREIPVSHAACAVVGLIKARRPTMRSPASKASLRTGSWLRRRKSSRPVTDVPIAVEEVDGINNILHYLLLAARRSSPVRAAALSPVQSESPAPATARRGLRRQECR